MANDVILVLLAIGALWFFSQKQGQMDINPFQPGTQPYPQGFANVPLIGAGKDYQYIPPAGGFAD